jgi:hypothetical protein
MRRLIAAALISMAGLVAAPANATTGSLVTFCTGFLDRYEAAMDAQRDQRLASHRVSLARFHYYQHLRRKARRTAEFCECFLANIPGGNSPVSQACGFPHILVRDD